MIYTKTQKQYRTVCTLGIFPLNKQQKKTIISHQNDDEKREQDYLRALSKYQRDAHVADNVKQRILQRETAHCFALSEELRSYFKSACF